MVPMAPRSLDPHKCQLDLIFLVFVLLCEVGETIDLARTNDASEKIWNLDCPLLPPR